MIEEKPQYVQEEQRVEMSVLPLMPLIKRKSDKDKTHRKAGFQLSKKKKKKHTQSMFPK